MREYMSRTKPSRPAAPFTSLGQVEGLRRAWPQADGSIIFECVAPGTGLLRAGRIGAAGHTHMAPYAQDPALPSLSPGHEGRLVVHRLGRRAVVMGTSSVTKLVRPGRARALVPQGLAQPLRDSGIRTAKVLRQGADQVELELLPGRSLHELGDQGAQGWLELARRWPQVARARTDLPPHSAQDEARTLQRWAERAQAAGAISHLQQEHGPWPLWAAVLTACARLTEGSGPVVVAHRDLHDGQVLWDARSKQISLLDLDTAASAEAALDLANLWAHAELMAAQGRLSQASLNRIGGLLDHAAASSPTNSARVSAYYQATRLRLALIHVFRPGAPAWLPQWVEQSLELQHQQKGPGP